MANKNAELFEKLIEILAQENIRPAYGLEQIQKFVSEEDLSDVSVLFVKFTYKSYETFDGRLEYVDISKSSQTLFENYDDWNPYNHLPFALKWDENGWRRAEFKKMFAVEVEGELFVSGSKYES